MQMHTTPGEDVPSFSSMTSSEDSIRHLKASESVVAAFHAVGFPSPGGELAAVITNFVKSETRGIPARQLASMTPGSGPLSASAAAGVNQYLASLTPQQREAAKAGVNPLDAAAMQKFTLILGAATGALGAYAGRDGGSAGGSSRFANLREGSAEVLGSVALASSYNSLLKEGYKASELNAVMPYAKELGWTNKAAVRALADTGPEGGELAKRWNDAKKRGDTAGMRAAEDEAEHRAKDGPTDKKQRGYRWMHEHFRKHRLSTEATLSAGERPSDGGTAHAQASQAASTAAAAKPNAKAADDLFAALDDSNAAPAAAAKAPDKSPDAKSGSAPTATNASDKSTDPKTTAAKPEESKGSTPTRSATASPAKPSGPAPT